MNSRNLLLVTFSSAIAIAVSSAAMGAGTASSNTIFTNKAPGAGWVVSGYSSTSAIPAASANQGDSGAILATVTSGYGSFTFDHRSDFYAITYFKPADFGTLSFDINPGSTVTNGQQALQIGLGDSLPNSSLSKFVTLKANTWSHVSIPLSTLNPKSANFYQLVFFNNSNTSKVNFLIDHVALSATGVVPAPSPTAKPTSSPTPSPKPTPVPTPLPAPSPIPAPAPSVKPPIVLPPPVPSPAPSPVVVPPAPVTPPAAGISFTPAVALNSLTMVPNRDSVVVHVPFVSGAKDYRVLVLPAGASVAAASNGGEQVNGANIFCAGERQHNAASTITAYSEDKPWTNPQYTFKSLLGHIVNTAFWDQYAGLKGVVARRTFEVQPEVMRDIEVTGLTGPTDVYVEALDTLCPYTGPYGQTHKDIDTVGYQGGSVVTRPEDRVKFSIYTEAEIKARYGSLIHNGHGPGAILASQGPTTAPKILARSAKITLTPDKSKPVPATFFDDFSSDADAFKLLDIPTVQASMGTKSNSHRYGVDGMGGFQWTDAYSEVRQNSKWTVYTYDQAHSDVYVKDGQLHTVLADGGQDIFAGNEMVPRKSAHLSDTAYLHVGFEVASDSTMRRYWMFNLCGSTTPGATLNADGSLKAAIQHDAFFYQDTGSSPSLGGWNCIQAFTRDGTPFSFDNPKTVYHPVYDPSTDSENPATAKVQYYEEFPETDLDIVVNKPLAASLLPEVQGYNAQVAKNLTVQMVGPVQYPGNTNVTDRSWFYQMDKAGNSVASMLADQNLISPRTHFDFYVKRDRLVMYVNGKQRLCNDLIGSSKLTMADAVPVFSQILYHSAAERDGFLDSDWNRGQQHYYKNNTPFVDERSWDNIGFEENTSAPADFDSGYCFTPTSITNP